MKRNNVSSFEAVVRSIEEILRDNPRINMLSLTVDMSENPIRAKVCYIDGTIGETRFSEIEVKYL